MCPCIPTSPTRGVCRLHNSRQYTSADYVISTVNLIFGQKFRQVMWPTAPQVGSWREYGLQRQCWWWYASPRSHWHVKKDYRNKKNIGNWIAIHVEWFGIQYAQMRENRASDQESLSKRAIRDSTAEFTPDKTTSIGQFLEFSHCTPAPRANYWKICCAFTPYLIKVRWDAIPIAGDWSWKGLATSRHMKRATPCQQLHFNIRANDYAPGRQAAYVTISCVLSQRFIYNAAFDPVKIYVNRESKGAVDRIEHWRWPLRQFLWWLMVVLRRSRIPINSPCAAHFQYHSTVASRLLRPSGSIALREENAISLVFMTFIEHHIRIVTCIPMAVLKL